jgi:predicted AAA+ superfamily ATPase
MYLEELIIYTPLSNDPIINKYIAFIEGTHTAQIRKAYFDLVKDLIGEEMSFETYLYTKMLEVDNKVLERLSQESYDINVLDKACLKNDLEIIHRIVKSDINGKIGAVEDSQNILGQLITKESASTMINAYKNYFHAKLDLEKDEAINQFIQLIRTYGTGLFAKNHVFYINQQDQLIPVRGFSPLPWDEIYDYKFQKEALKNNTKALAEGRPYHHVLLEGASGTGKSSSVKAVAELYKNQKLRLIQLYKSQLRALPNLLELLNGSIFKFIIFIDDLSFEANDDDYKLLKSYIEGGIINEATNIAFYVTSNRQHLIKEVRSDREGDIHLEDSIQETTSLSARFGLHLTYMKMNQKEYLAMIAKMLEKENMLYDPEKMELEAKRWSLLHRGMSGRIAMQFVKHLKMNKA